MEEALKQFGLNNKEVKVYLACLELGEARASEIAKKTGIERTNCYSILSKLLSLGLVLELSSGKRKRFAAAPPDKLPKLLRERLQKIEEALPELKSIYNLSPKKPKIRFYEGKEGIFNILDEIIGTLNKGDFHLHCGPDYEILVDVLGMKTIDAFIKRRVAKGVTSHIMTNKTPFMVEHKKKSKEGRRKVKFVKKQDIPARLHIFGPKIALISLKEPIIGVVIEDKAIADLMKMFFQFLWDSLPD